MAQAGKYLELYVNGYDLTTYFNALDFPDEVGTIDTTTFGGTSDETSMPNGIRKGDPGGEGFFVATVSEPVDATLRAALGGTGVDTAYPLGGVVGQPAILWPALENAYNIKSGVADAVRTSLKTKSNGAKRTGASLHAKATRTAAYTGTTYDSGAAGELASGPWYAHLHATTVTADVTILVETSNDNSTWVTLCTFTVITSGTGLGSERKTGTAAVHRYRRIRVTVGSATFTVALATD